MTKGNIVKAEQANREEGGIHRAGRANREGGRGNASRHLDDGEKRVDATEDLRLDGDPQHRQVRQGRDHSWKVSRSAGARDDQSNAHLLRVLRELIHVLRRAMCRDDLSFKIDAEEAERLAGVTHRLPIRGTAHDDRDGRHGDVGGAEAAQCFKELWSATPSIPCDMTKTNNG